MGHDSDLIYLRSLACASSAPIPKFASTRGTSDANFGIKRGTSNVMILVRFLNLKFLHELAAQTIGTSNSLH
jgi:hypothetical protein